MTWLTDSIEQLEETYGGSPWYGKSLSTILREIEPSKAGTPIDNSHSIYQIAYHMLAWRKYLVEKLQGNAIYAIELGSSADWVQGSTVGAAEWSRLLADFDENQKRLLALLNEQSEALLEKTVPGKKYGFRKLIEGMVQHDIYHAGQLVTTARILGAYKPNS